MQLDLDGIIKETSSLAPVPLDGIAVYQENIPLLKKHVDETLTAAANIHELIGNNPLQIMYDNHTHHTAFMLTVFSIGNFELLARTIPWVYRAYAGHNFSYDYFPLELSTWLEALEKHTPGEKTAEIKSVYNWMIQHHEDMIAISKEEQNLTLPISEDWLDRKNTFLAAAIEGDHQKCMTLAMESIKTSSDIEPFYMYILQPVMYEVGMLWERGAITVAHEHLASAIVGRVMASTSMLEHTAESRQTKVVVTSAPNEFHEIGAWMISDILEHEGYNVKYLGANTPEADLIDLLQTFQPQVLAVSVTMPTNILHAKKLISAIKKNEKLRSIKIFIGGRPFNDTPDLWKSTGADYFAENAQAISRLLHKEAA